MKVRETLHALPFLLIAAAFALFSAGVPAGGAWGGWMPDLTPVPLFYFLRHRPDRVPMLAILAVGLLADLLYGRIPGTGALALLAAGEAARIGLSGALSSTALGRAVLLVGFCAAHALLLGIAFVATGDISLNTLGHQALWTAVSYLPSVILMKYFLRIRAERKRELV